MRLVIVLAAIDSMSHLKALKQLTMLLSEEKRTKQLIEAEDLASVQKTNRPIFTSIKEE